jgi:hypothetical protein
MKLFLGSIPQFQQPQPRPAMNVAASIFVLDSNGLSPAMNVAASNAPG